MKELENKKALNEVEEEKVAGGMIWPGIPPLDPFNPLNENIAEEIRLLWKLLTIPGFLSDLSPIRSIN